MTKVMSIKEFWIEALCPNRPQSPWFLVRSISSEGHARDYAEEFASSFECRVRVLKDNKTLCEFNVGLTPAAAG
jgi:hypothetical protein